MGVEGVFISVVKIVHNSYEKISNSLKIGIPMMHEVEAELFEAILTS